MKKFTDAELKGIMKNLKNGQVYCGIRHQYGVGTINLTIHHNIGWEHYGTSAEPCTIRNLRWIIETIFEDCEDIVAATWSDYHLGYIPIDKKYKGIDYSNQYPNVLNA